MMTKIRQIERVREHYPKAIGKRLENHRYGVLMEKDGELIGQGRTKREAWKEALRLCQERRK